MKLSSNILILLSFGLLTLFSVTKSSQILSTNLSKSNIQISDSGFYDSECSEDYECGVDTNLECIGRRCKCQLNNGWDNNTLKCYPKCTNEYCFNEDVNSICKNEICVCNEEYTYSNVFKKCIETYKQCDKDCPSFAYCNSNECECMFGYEWNELKTDCVTKLFWNAYLWMLMIVPVTMVICIFFCCLRRRRVFPSTIIVNNNGFGDQTYGPPPPYFVKQQSNLIQPPPYSGQPPPYQVQQPQYMVPQQLYPVTSASSSNSICEAL